MADDFSFSFDDLQDLLSQIDDGGGKPLDVMHEETDREIEKVRKKLAKEYKQAEKELKQKANDHFKKFEKADKEKARLVKEGKLSNEDYITWRKNKILYDKTLQAKVKSMSDYLASVDRHAADIVNGRLAGIYANNYNYELYKIEKGMGATTSLVLHNEKSVERLASKNPKLLPNPSKKTQEKIKSGKIKKWSQRKINNAITQGILQGEPIMDIADRLTKVVSMEWSSAVRNARTSMTGAQNAGRLGTYKDAGRLGIKTKKQWMATLDERTRESHQELDGESVPVDEPFSNGLMFPADPDGEPEEVYNCRCTMVADIEDYPDEGFERYVDGESVGDMTYKDWLQMKGGTQEAEGLSFADKIKSIRDNEKLTQTEKIEQAGQIFADEINNGYLQEVDGLEQTIDKKRDEMFEKLLKLEGEAEQIKLQEDFIKWEENIRKRFKPDNALADKLSKVRSVGYKNAKELKSHLKNSRSPMRVHVESAYNHYPTEWIEKSIKRSKLGVKKVNRGYYDDIQEVIAISGWNDEMVKGTCFHELGHRFEQSVPEILKQERAFYKRRTDGEDLKWLGSGYGRSEKTRRDKFLNKYMGKDYGGSAYELVSMGFEYAYTDPAKLAKDPDMQKWIYGILCIL